MTRTSVLRCGDRDAIASRALDLLIESLRDGTGDVERAPGAGRRIICGGPFTLLWSDPLMPGSHVTAIASAIHAGWCL